MRDLTRFDREGWELKHVLLILLIIGFLVWMVWITRHRMALDWCFTVGHEPHIINRSEKDFGKLVNFCERCGLVYWEKRED